MISTSSGLDRDFILGLVDDLRTYVVIDGSLTYCFDDLSSKEILEHLLPRKRVILSERFNGLLGEERLIAESHRLKRGVGHRNAIIDLPYHAGKRGRERIQRDLMEESMEVRRDIRELHRLNVFDRFADKEGIIHDGLSLFDATTELSRKYPLTLMTSDQCVVQSYARLQRTPNLVDRKRFEVALIYPGEQAFSYLYPALVKSERFDELAEISQVA